MERPGGSRTADIVCFARALARVDPYALTVLAHRPSLFWAKSLQPLQNVPMRISSPLTGGLVGTVGGRTQTFDDHLLTALGAGAQQLILLGAGLDARPWRLGPVLSERAVFLVDHPASARVRARATSHLPRRADVRVDVDFAQDDLAGALQAAGVCDRLPSVVVWEGVSMYLPEVAVRHTLQALAQCLALDSVLIFDVWCPTRGLSAQVEKLGRLGLRWLGEPLDFSVPNAAIPSFLKRDGWALETLTHAVDAARAFGGFGLPGLWFAHARLFSRAAL